MMIAQRKIFIPKRIEKHNIVTLFVYAYKQEYGMLYRVRYRTENLNVSYIFEGIMF